MQPASRSESPSEGHLELVPGSEALAGQAWGVAGCQFPSNPGCFEEHVPFINSHSKATAAPREGPTGGVEPSFSSAMRYFKMSSRELGELAFLSKMEGHKPSPLSHPC